MRGQKSSPYPSLCKVLGVSLSGYFAWRSRPACWRQREDLVLLAHVRSAFQLSNGTYGPALDQTRLANAGLPDQQRRLALAGSSLVPPVEYQRQLLVAPDYGQHPTRPLGLEAAACGVFTEHLEAADRMLKALELGRPKRTQFEQLAQVSACGVRNHHGSWLSELLDTGRKVRRLADDRLLTGRTFSDEVAHHHEPGGDPNTAGQRLARGCPELLDGLDDREPGPHSSLDFVLMRPWPAKISQDAVAHQLGHVPLKARDLTCDGVLIGSQDLTHFFGVKLGRQSR